jgi:two-component system, sensor histidine kinase and response regulator
MVDVPRDEPVLVLSLLPAGPVDRRLAVTAVLISLAVFFVVAPFARTPLPKVAAFMPSYESALCINDLITAALLFGQFTIGRSRALQVLASGYLFTALITIPHALSFPGLFSDAGLLGGGSQSTAWLYMFWHGGFPAVVVGYALLGKGRTGPQHRPAALAILRSIAAVVGVVLALTLLATAGEAALPAIMQGSHYTPAMIFVVATVWALSLIALLALFVRRPHAVLDLWLMAVMCAWLCDIALSAVLNAGRFDFGFYAGRIFGLAAASFVLVVLLLETIALYARLARSMDAERQEREQRLIELRAELIHVSRVSELGQMVSTLAHEVNQPLTAIGNYLRAGQRLLCAGDAANVQAALAKAGDEATRANAIIKRLRDFIKKNDSVRQPEELGPVLEEIVALALIGAGWHNLGVEMRVDPLACAALIDKVQIQQVLPNLIRNAAEAMSDSTHPVLVIATAPAAEGMIELSVADRGPGLRAQVRERLFQPFVTTKSDGMGVGLSICHSIVEAHGGRIWAEDNPGGGTVFRLTVPDARAAAERRAAAE